MTENRKILVVDDEEDVRLFLQDFLVERDMDVENAGSGTECLEKIESFKPHIILLDIMMPGMDGLQCLEKIREKTDEITVIMITALKDEARINKAKKLGARNYIIKPFSLGYLENELLKLIQE